MDASLYKISLITGKQEEIMHLSKSWHTSLFGRMWLHPIDVRMLDVPYTTERNRYFVVTKFTHTRLGRFGTLTLVDTKKKREIDFKKLEGLFDYFVLVRDNGCIDFVSSINNEKWVVERIQMDDVCKNQ